MFSPTVSTVRKLVIDRVFNSGSQLSSNNEPDPLEFEELSGSDQDVLSDLYDLEEQFQHHTSLRFHFTQLQFISRTVTTGALPNSDAVMKLLAPAASSTQQFLYRLYGLRNLLPDLQVLRPTHPGLRLQRDELVAATNTEIELLLAGLERERIAQCSRTITVDGIRRVDPVESKLNPYTSPLSTAVIVLIAIIHTSMGVARDHCNIVLQAIRSILIMASRMQDQQSARFMNEHTRDIPTTLPTALHRLNLQPELKLFVVCEKCNTLYADDAPETPTKCTNCTDNGTVCDANLYASHFRGGKSWKRPIRRYSFHPLESWLSHLLQIPGIEDLLESAKPSPQPTMTDVWEAPYFCSFPGEGQASFFDAPKGELRLAMLIFHDFFNPFHNKTSGKLCSVGCFIMICLNLPPELRYDISYAYLASIVPGPKEPSTQDIQNFIRPLADNIAELSSRGVWISKTHKYPHGRRVRVVAPIASMDAPALHAFGGFAPHSHTCCCHVCSTLHNQMAQSDLIPFELRDMTTHRQQVSMWENATSTQERKLLYSQYGVRSSQWLRFQWWNAFAGSPIGPLHWNKNILEKQLRHNMGWTWTLTTGIPAAHALNRPISELEYEWGNLAFMGATSAEFLSSKLPAPLLHYLCRKYEIYEAGVAARDMLSKLNRWRLDKGIILPNGQLSETHSRRAGVSISVAKAHYYLSIAGDTKDPPAYLNSHANRSDLVTLCGMFSLPTEGLKPILVEQLLQYYATIRVPDLPDTISGNIPTEKVAVLGKEVLAEIQHDMALTSHPSWLKHPPKNFATVSHGKIGAEEYKSLAMVSLSITLVRLWGCEPTGPFRERLDHFLHLVLAVRILAFQSLTESDISAFDLHYREYFGALTELYPHETVTYYQHTGLHIPMFLRLLGPSTRYSENTGEMFNQMLQDVTTNFKFGDLELTMHREFIMASRLKGLMEQPAFTQSLDDFSTVVQGFLRERFPSLQQESTWQSVHNNKPYSPSVEIRKLLDSWTTEYGTPPLSSALLLCSRIQLGNLLFAVSGNSLGDSFVLFSPPCSSSIVAGRIENIYQECQDTESKSHQPRLVLFVHAFKSLDAQDSQRDPYGSHPLIGRTGARMAQLYYDEFDSEVYIIEPRDLISHAAVCSYTDPENTVSKSCVVVLSLDLKHKRFA